MKVTTISFFRFEGLWNRFWAFVQVQLSKGRLRRQPGVVFGKIMGTGTGEGFHPWPNFSVYAVLATWESWEAARQGLEHGALHQSYERHASEGWHVYLSAVRATGSWDREKPFPIGRPIDGAIRRPLGILTRASIGWRHVLAFWRSVPRISASVADRPGLRFKIGMGESPVFHLTTFSIWDSQRVMRCFAYENGPHRDGMLAARRRGWFAEDLFARFEVLDSVGTFQGRDPLAASLTALPSSCAGPEPVTSPALAAASSLSGASLPEPLPSARSQGSAGVCDE
ncbi:MAG: spheroidene monooxygenase [Myxococcota bacterium]